MTNDLSNTRNWGLSLAEVFTLVAGLMVQTCVKVYEGWRSYLGETATLNGDEIKDRIKAEAGLGDLTLPSDSDTQAFESFVASVDFRHVAVQAMTLHLMGTVPNRSRDLRRHVIQVLSIHGMSDTAASTTADELLAKLAIVAEAIAPRDPGVMIRTRKLDKERARELEAAVDQQRRASATRIVESLAAIADCLDEDHVDLARVDGKVAKLRAATRQIHGTIAPPSLQGVQRVPFDDVYVPPVLAERRGPRTVRAWTMPHDLEGLFEDSPRRVVLGDPGAGKSTLTSWIVWQVSRGRAVGDALIAVAVILREHSERMSDSGLDLIDAIATTARERYQIAFTRSEIAFLCGSGRLFVIFDGLDEILDLTKRGSLVRSIESFSVIYDRATLVVTSRLVGYEQAPLDDGLFDVVRIGQFSNRQVRLYVGKWFARMSDLSVVDQRRMADSFISDSAPIEDLRSNALLLSLLCTVYKTQGYLPRNRPQVYAECAKMLFDTWDRRRRLRPAFDFDAHINVAVQHLAAWIFDSQERQAGVPQADLENRAADYFEEWQFGNRVDALRASTEFIDFCRGRAWILTDVGTSATNTLYGFTHRTFLEYFTALYYVSALSEDDLVAFVVDKSGLAAWNMVCQMLVQLAGTKAQGLEDRMALATRDSLSGRDPQSREIALSVCVESVRNVPLRPDTVARLVESCGDLYLNTERRSLRTASPTLRTNTWIGAAPVAIENRLVANSALSEHLGNRLRSNTEFDFYATHTAEYALHNHSSACEIAQFLGADVRNYLSQQLLGIAGGRPTAAILLGTRCDEGVIDALALRVLIGSDQEIVPIQSDWGASALPNLFELGVIFASCSSSEAELVTIQFTYTRVFSRILARACKDDWIRGYKPHSLFWSSGAPDSPSLAPLNLESRETLFCAAAVLCEKYVGEGQHPGAVAELASRRWGGLEPVSMALRQRYSTESSRVSLSEYPTPFLDSWSAGVPALDIWRQRAQNS